MPKTLQPKNEIDKKILKARCSGLSFCELNEDDSRVATDKIMFTGAAASGSALPQTEFFAKFIADVLIDFINNFGYEELTLDEILLAIMINADGRTRTISGEHLEQIEFTGVCFNVGYISKILKNYKTLRDSLDRQLENKLNGY